MINAQKFGASAVILIALISVTSCGDSAFAPQTSESRSLRLVPSAIELDEGSDTTLRAIVVDGDDQEIQGGTEGFSFGWVSSDTGVVSTVGSAGSSTTLRGLTAGTSYINVQASPTGSAGVGSSAYSASSSLWDRILVRIRARPTQLQVTSGNNQEGLAGQPLPAPVTVRLLDRSGNGIMGARVDFVPTNGGTVSSSSAQTDIGGYASVLWTLGPGLGIQTIGVKSAWVAEVTVSATATTAPASRLTIVTGDQQQGRAGQAAPTPLSVLVVDDAGRPIANAALTWAAGTGAGTITPASARTDSAGRASASWTFGTGVGAQVATATINSLTATFNAQVSAGPATEIIKTSGDAQSGSVGSVLGDSLVVQVRDAYGNPVTGATVSWTVLSGGGSVSPTQGTTSTSGTARTAWRLTAPGSASVRATVQGAGNATFTAMGLDVNTPPPPPPVSRVDVSPSTMTLNALGAQSSLTATSYDSNNQAVPGAAVSWTSLNSSVATVDSTGRVTARSVGTARIVGSAACCTAADTATVTVTQAVAKLTVAPRTLTVDAGSAGTLTVTATDANNNVIAAPAVIWSSSNTGVATVAQGRVSGLAVGSAVIRVTSGSIRDSAMVTVRTPTPTRVVVTPASVSLTALGAQAALTAQAYDANNQVVPGAQIRWSTLHPNIGTVDSMGRVTAKSVGTALIVATTVCCAQADTTAVDITQRITSLAVSPTTLSLQVGQAGTVTATARDANQNVVASPAITWSSSNNAVATVTNGQVSGVAAGTVMVRAVSGTVRDSAAVTVSGGTTPPPPTGSTIFYDGFESGNLGAWEDGYNAALHQVVTNSTTAYAGSRYLRMTIPGGNEGSHLARFFMPGYDSLFVRLHVRYAANWTGNTYLALLRGSRTDNQWSSFGVAGDCPTGSEWFATNVTTNGSGNPGPTLFYSYYVGMPKQADGVTCWGTFGDGREVYQPQANMTRDVWHRVEFWVKLNTPGQANSVQKMWVDGQLRGDWNGLVFRTTNNLKLNSLTITAYSSFTSAQARDIYYDDVTVATAPLGGTWQAPNPTPPPPAPAPVASVTIAPAAPALNVGGTVQMTATMKDASGNTLTGRAVSWSSSNGAVASINASSGLLSGTGAGTAVITATSEGVSKTATATVTAAPSGGFLAPDIAFHNFDDGTLGPFNGGNGGVSVVDDPTGRLNGKVARILYDINPGGEDHQDDNVAIKRDISSGNHNHIFVRWDLVLGRPTGNDPMINRKILYVQSGSYPDPGANWAMVVGLEDDVTSGAYRLRLSTSYGWAGGTFSVGYSNYNFTFGEKYTVEVEILRNSPVTSSNGLIRVWVTNPQGVTQMVHERLNLKMSPSDVGVREVWIGQQADRFFASSDVNEYRYVDRAAISTRRIGP